MRSRHDRWVFRNNNIKRRKSLVYSLTGFEGMIKNNVVPDGKYANNNIVNQLIGLSRNTKTNTRKSKMGFRTKGGYGEDMKWNTHDKRQIEDMDYQEKDIEQQA